MDQTANAEDDLTGEFAPSFALSYHKGHARAIVRAVFYDIKADRRIRLRPSASVRVNEQPLQLERTAQASYAAEIVPSDEYTFEMQRDMGSPIIRATISSPKLNIRSFPTAARGGDPISVQIDPGLSAAAVASDVYMLVIFGRYGASQYQGQMGGANVVTFRLVQLSKSPPGRYRAEIYRLQRTTLRDRTPNLSGAAVLTTREEFEIDVLDT